MRNRKDIEVMKNCKNKWLCVVCGCLLLCAPIQGAEQGDVLTEKNVVALTARAQAGDSNAQYRLGKLYGEGRFVTKDMGKAFTWFSKSAEQGNADGENAVGICFFSGMGVETNRSEGVEWFHKSAQQENEKALNMLGAAYLNGLGVAKDIKRGAGYMREAAEKGQDVAQCNLGNMYMKGFGVERSVATALRWWRKSADAGNPEAMLAIGKLYDKGKEVDKDPALAFEWFLKAATLGDARAQFNVAIMYIDGDGVAKDPKKAFSWCLKSAEQGFSKAQNSVGLLYKDGMGTARDLKKAVEWLLKSCAQPGNGLPQYNLASMYFVGLGVQKDGARAKELLDESAKRGCKPALELLKAPSWEEALRRRLAEAGSTIGLVENITLPLVAYCTPAQLRTVAASTRKEHFLCSLEAVRRLRREKSEDSASLLLELALARKENKYRSEVAVDILLQDYPDAARSYRMKILKEDCDPSLLMEVAKGVLADDDTELVELAVARLGEDLKGTQLFKCRKLITGTSCPDAAAKALDSIIDKHSDRSATYVALRLRNWIRKTDDMKTALFDMPGQYKSDNRVILFRERFGTNGLSVLRRSLEEEEFPCRPAAIRSLGKLADHQAREKIFAIYEGEARKTPMREACVEALSLLKDKRILPVLMKGAQSEASGGTARISFGGWKIGGTSYPVAEAALARLGNYEGPDVYAALIDALAKYDKPNIVEAAAKGLVAHGDRRAIRALRNAQAAMAGDGEKIVALGIASGVDKLAGGPESKVPEGGYIMYLLKYQSADGAYNVFTDVPMWSGTEPGSVRMVMINSSKLFQHTTHTGDELIGAVRNMRADPRKAGGIRINKTLIHSFDYNIGVR